MLGAPPDRLALSHLVPPSLRHYLARVVRCYSDVHAVRHTDHHASERDIMLWTLHTAADPAQQSDLDVLERPHHVDSALCCLVFACFPGAGDHDIMPAYLTWVVGKRVARYLHLLMRLVEH